jgi:hypothetical protein
VVVKKVEGEITGTITYYAPGPPFELPLQEGGCMSMSLAPTGALLYRHTFTHPIVVTKKRP